MNKAFYVCTNCQLSIELSMVASVTVWRNEEKQGLRLILNNGTAISGPAIEDRRDLIDEINDLNAALMKFHEGLKLVDRTRDYRDLVLDLGVNHATAVITKFLNQPGYDEDTIIEYNPIHGAKYSIRLGSLVTLINNIDEIHHIGLNNISNIVSLNAQETIEIYKKLYIR